MRKEIPLPKAKRLINSGHLLLITSSFKDRSNILTLNWYAPLSYQVPLVGISVSREHFSHDLIKRSGELVMNIPTWELLDGVVYCGTHSGREVDKTHLPGLTLIKATSLGRAPVIEECAGSLEAYVRDIKPIGDHSLFICEVIYAQVKEEFFVNDVWDVSQARLIFHLGGKYFSSPSDLVKVK